MPPELAAPSPSPEDPGMKLLLSIGMLCVSLASLADCARAQGSCPYTAAFTAYGSACSPVSSSLPSLGAPFPPGSGCHETILYDVPVLPSAPLTHRWLVAGVSAAAAPLPGGGCTLLATIDVLIDLPALEGGLALSLLLPPDPVLVGASIHMQGIDRRHVLATGAKRISTTNGLRLDLL